MRVYYFPLESYQERYTSQLTKWTTDRFDQMGIDVFTVGGKYLRQDDQIANTGPLDNQARPYFALTQVANFIEIAGDITNDDVIYIDDMFTPGYEAIPYFLQQRKLKPRIFARNHAQSMDIYDFTFPMRKWMKHYELMVDHTVDGIICGSTVHLELMRVSGFEAPVHVFGLPFDKADVRRLAGTLVPHDKRDNRIVFSSRFDWEKQPNFFMDLAEAAKLDPVLKDFSFEILTGKKVLSSNHVAPILRAEKLSKDGILTIRPNLTKAEYYSILKHSKLQFNCALQDFISYTMLEASALSVPSLVPCFRGFPEAMIGMDDYMYTPWSHKDALKKMATLVQRSIHINVGLPSDFNDQCLSKIGHLIKAVYNGIQSR